MDASGAEICKTERPRTLPLSARLRAVLSMVARDPEGQLHPPTAFVFGNEAGEPVACIRKSWDATVLRAHGTTPAYKAGYACADAGVSGRSPSD